MNVLTVSDNYGQQHSFPSDLYGFSTDGGLQIFKKEDFSPVAFFPQYQWVKTQPSTESRSEGLQNVA